MIQPRRHAFWLRLLQSVGMVCVLSLAAVSQAGTVSNLAISSNGPWSVGQNNAQYTIALTHSRQGNNANNNAVTVTGQLPAGIWPTWSGSRTTDGFACTNAFDNGAKRYSVTCTRSNVPDGSRSITLPVWIDQLSTGSISNTVTANTGSGSSATSPQYTTTVNGVQSAAWPNSCTAQGGSLSANQFADNGTFGSISSNAVGSATNVNSTMALATGSTTMNYNTGDLADGDYRISNRVSKVPTSRDNNWYWTVGDHTSLAMNGGKGDPNQLMMVMNASNAPGIFYQETLTVVPDTTYEFSLWAIHANNLNFYTPLPFNIELAVDRIGVDDNNNGVIDEPGEAQAIANSGNVGGSLVPTWRQYGALFNSGSATQVRFIFRNNGPGGGGNDLAIDDMVLAECTGLPAGNLEGTLYYDDNRNNALDGDETGRLPAGIAVELLDSNGLVIGTSETNASGEYAFQNVALVPSAVYTVRVVTGDSDIPAGAQLGTPNDVSVTLTEGATAQVNFGFDAIRLLLQKQWVSAAVDDAVTITAQSGATVLRSFQAIANTTDELDTDTSSVNLTVGGTIMISEAFTTGDAQNYASELACSGSVDTDLSDGLQVSASDSYIVCTYTNARRLADLVIDKSNAESEVASGAQTTYQIVVTNNGPAAADGALVKDPAVPGLDCVTPAQFSCEATGGAICPSAPLSITALQDSAGGLAIPTLPHGGSVTLTLTCTVTATGP